MNALEELKKESVETLYDCLVKAYGTTPHVGISQITIMNEETRENKIGICMNKICESCDKCKLYGFTVYSGKDTPLFLCLNCREEGCISGQAD